MATQTKKLREEPSLVEKGSASEMGQEILDRLNSATLSTHRSELPQLDGEIGYPYKQVQNFPKNVGTPDL